MALRVKDPASCLLEDGSLLPGLLHGVRRGPWQQRAGERLRGGSHLVLPMAVVLASAAVSLQPLVRELPMPQGRKKEKSMDI